MNVSFTRSAIFKVSEDGIGVVNNVPFLYCLAQKKTEDMKIGFDRFFGNMFESAFGSLIRINRGPEGRFLIFFAEFDHAVVQKLYYDVVWVDITIPQRTRNRGQRRINISSEFFPMSVRDEQWEPEAKQQFLK